MLKNILCESVIKKVTVWKYVEDPLHLSVKTLWPNKLVSDYKYKNNSTPSEIRPICRIWLIGSGNQN